MKINTNTFLGNRGVLKIMSRVLLVVLSMATAQAFGAAKTVAVLPFKSTALQMTTNGRFTDIKWSQKDTDFLTSEVVNELVHNPNFKVVERDNSRLKNLEEEKKFGMMTSGDMSAIGRELGANYLVYGDIELVEVDEKDLKFESSDMKVTEFQGRMIVNMRVVDVGSSQIVLSEKVNYQAVKRMNPYQMMTPLAFLNELKERTVKGLVARVSETINPVKIASVSMHEVYINHGEGSGMRMGTILEVYAEGAKIVNPDTGEVLGVQEKNIGIIKVTRVMPKFSSAVIMNASEPIKVGAICRVQEPINGVHERVEKPESRMSSDKPVNW